MAFRNPNLHDLLEVVRKWNAEYPIGTVVDVQEDFKDAPTRTTTRSVAQVLSGHSVVIWLDGISGCYLLSCVKAVK